jgi:hypothetical protein
MMARVMTPMLVAVLVSTPAAAQDTPQDEYNQSISAGAQWALPHTWRGETPGVQVSWRHWLSPRLGVGTDFRWWVRNKTTDIDTSPQVSSQGVVVPRMLGREERQLSSYGFGVGVVARESFGRLSLIGGAGPGFFVDRTKHDTEINGTRNAGSSTYSTLGAQFLVELELRATSHLSAFAGFRFEWRDFRTSESSSGYPTAGVRFAF